MFWLVDNEIGLFWPLYHKKTASAFSLLKDGPLNFIGKKISFGLFGVKLGSFQRYWTGKWISFFKFLASDLDFYLIALKKTF